MARNIQNSTSGSKGRSGFRLDDKDEPYILDEGESPTKEPVDEPPRGYSSLPCDPGSQVWWYRRLNHQTYGIHVDWEKWRGEYLQTKENHPLERFPYMHEYFHHITDTWEQKHGLYSTEMDMQYQEIWRKESSGFKGFKSGILLGEALAEDFATKILGYENNPFTRGHPSYSLAVTDWAACSAMYACQILNGTYEIFERPVSRILSSRIKIHSNMTWHGAFEQYEDELWTNRDGFIRDPEQFTHAQDTPQSIPFYVHACFPEWHAEVIEFSSRNQLSNPRFLEP